MFEDCAEEDVATVVLRTEAVAEDDGANGANVEALALLARSCSESLQFSLCWIPLPCVLLLRRTFAWLRFWTMIVIWGQETFDEVSDVMVCAVHELKNTMPHACSDS